MRVFKKNKNTIRYTLAPIKYLLLTFSILSIQKTVFAQDDSTQQKPVTDSAKILHDSTEIRYDSAKNRLFNHIKQFGDSDRRRKVIEYAEDTIATKQDATIELIKKLSLEAESYLESGLDTNGLTTELAKIKRWYDITSDGVFTNTGPMQTHRNLETSYKIMRELLTRMTEKKTSLDRYYKTLVRLRNNIDSLYKDDILYKFSSDSAVLMRYVERLTVVKQEIGPTDTSLKKTLISISDLQPTVNRMVNKLSSAIDQIQVFQKELSSKQFQRETSNLGGPVKYVRNFNDLISFSMMKGWLSFIFYVHNEVGRIILLLILIIVCTIFLVNLKQNAEKENLLHKNVPEQAVLKYPLLSALVIVLNIFQFVFIDPPFLFTVMLWIISGLSMTFILKNVVPKNGMNVWLTAFLLFLLTSFDAMILQSTRPERWFMFTLSVIGIIAGTIIIVVRWRKEEIREKLFIYFVGFAVILQIVSILNNSYGRYNLSKTCLTAAYFNVVLAVLFFWTLQFIDQGLALASQVYNKAGKKLFNINFERIGNKTPIIFYVILFAGWFVLFARSFYIYKLIADPIKNFIFRKRMIGEFSFSIGNVLEFFLILYISGMISRIVSFFASGKPGEYHAGRKGGLGSWLLIIRIAIISIGVLVAFAAVGIPMDRLTIILSALSVGIGFGLQNLVNNLVSGLIISFEKPVSVGDTIEVGGQSGIVKSIGFRSSIIVTGAGADVVIPNGYLLNQQLVNWTRDKMFRSVDVPVGVAYGTNLEQAIKILEELPAKDDRIKIFPKPNVIVKQFNSSSIDLQLTFWVKNINNAVEVKSDIMLAIDSAFKENDITIPFPQQELRITRDEIRKENENENEKKQ